MYGAVRAISRSVWALKALGRRPCPPQLDPSGFGVTSDEENESVVRRPLDPEDAFPTAAARQVALFAAGLDSCSRATGQGLSVRKRDFQQGPEQRPVPGAMNFHRNGLADGLFEIALANVAVPEEDRRPSLDHPGLHLAAIALRIERKLNVGISPVDFCERTGESECL